MTTARTPYLVTFRPDFSDKLTGLVFEVDQYPRAAADGRVYVGLRIRTKSGRWARRTAWIDDLRTPDGKPYGSSAVRTPTGEPGIRLECANSAHRHHGAAIIRHTDQPIDADRACKLIDVAHHPVLSRAASVQQSGPWKA